VELENQKQFIGFYTQIKVFFQSKFRILKHHGDTLGDIQISIFLESLQIPNGYLNRIAFINLLSNQRSEKCGFKKIKRANPWLRTHPAEF
jgi:hypothetical protein